MVKFQAVCQVYLHKMSTKMGHVSVTYALNCCSNIKVKLQEEVGLIQAINFLSPHMKRQTLF